MQLIWWFGVWFIGRRSVWHFYRKLGLLQTVPQLRRLVADIPPRQPRFEHRSVICGGQKWHVAGFLRVLRFLLLIFIPLAASHSSSIIRSWYNTSISGRRTKCTQSHSNPSNYKKLWFLLLIILLSLLLLANDKIDLLRDTKSTSKICQDI
jgi:hypothetical protein